MSEAVQRVQRALDRISNLRASAANVEKRMTAEPDAWTPMACRGVEWSRGQIKMHDDYMEQARALEARLEAALRPVFETLPVDEEGR